MSFRKLFLTKKTRDIICHHRVAPIETRRNIGQAGIAPPFGVTPPPPVPVKPRTTDVNNRHCRVSGGGGRSPGAFR